MASLEKPISKVEPKRLYAIVNVRAGGYVETRFRRGVEFLRKRNWECSIHHTTSNSSIAGVVRRTLDEGYDVIAAAGGDGTISAVADALVHSEVPLLIVPCGTGNALARELAIPLSIERAMGILAIEHQVRRMDAMEVNGKHYVLVVSIGLTPTVMKETTQEDKRRYGRMAYFAEMLKRLFGLQPERFDMVIDGAEHNVRAAEIVITNVAQVGTTLVRWGPDVRVDDGKIEIFPVYARTLVDVIGVAWELLFGKRRGQGVQRIDAYTRVSITTSRPLLVEGDGDIIGETPLDLVVVPEALRVIVPKPGLLSQNPNLALLLDEMPIRQLLRGTERTRDDAPAPASAPSAPPSKASSGHIKRV